MNIDLTSQQHALIASVLLKHLPPGVKTYVFGSRARGYARKFSDLDLAIDCEGEVMSNTVLAALAYDFEESDLPFKVDIIDLNAISDNFKENIKKDLCRFEYC